ncbi:aspartate ammonia-lyase [Comamonas sp. BIGb0124]|uniref:aspartate ammonia-lyase n=1 Tax=Comamonas sp. BIGb0124 TaxID=2485130 RepID=UPI000F4AC768|nr:aspartate ammonia-lyase [Comamonas sp. BIGb0124]ROR22590.1 aspartate ammonia-lyase [Comamonas sp. BIGb0124]
MLSIATRQEHDFLGIRDIPQIVYWGVHTARALENFPISGTPISAMPELVRALAHIKKAAAATNAELGVLAPATAQAIVAACNDLLDGQHHDQFVVDVIQGGAGTSTNMNANEVIANLALEHLGHDKGDYAVVHPNDHVNASQSTNDVYPSALRLALWEKSGQLQPQLTALRQSLEAKAEQFAGVLKIGRTQLQDAVPMTLGQEFAAFASMLAADERRLAQAREELTEVNLGGTAIGTGINAPAGYAEQVCRRLAEDSLVPVRPATDLIAASQDTGAFVQLSGVLKLIAIRLSKICNDLRLLSSGPQAGYGDIRLPPRQAGSSIMPGKVNPVIPEAVNQVAFEIIGNDAAITLAAEAGQLQLNAFEPLIGWSLYKNLDHLDGALRTLKVHCVDGIEPRQDVLARQVRESVTLATALNPLIGYEKAAAIVKRAMATGQPLDRTAQELGILSAEEMDALLVPEKLTRPYSVTRTTLTAAVR